MTPLPNPTTYLRQVIDSLLTGHLRSGIASRVLPRDTDANYAASSFSCRCFAAWPSPALPACIAMLEPSREIAGSTPSPPSATYAGTSPSFIAIRFLACSKDTPLEASDAAPAAGKSSPGPCPVPTGTRARSFYCAVSVVIFLACAAYNLAIATADGPARWAYSSISASSA